MDTRGWSDIAYQVAVDQAGRAWTLRGLRTQSAANGNNDVNERYGAILLILVTGEQPTAAMKATTRAVIADFRRIYPRGTAIRPHSAVRPDPTDCPGPAARAAIARGDFTPGSSEDDDIHPPRCRNSRTSSRPAPRRTPSGRTGSSARTCSAVVKAYALDIKNYERQTDAADAARAAAAVWATAPDPRCRPPDSPAGASGRAGPATQSAVRAALPARESTPPGADVLSVGTGWVARVDLTELAERLEKTVGPVRRDARVRA